MGGRSLHRLLLLAYLALSKAQNDQRICAWYRPRYGVVREALFTDGGTILENGWQDGSWASSNPTQTYPSARVYAFNFSNAFEGSEPVNLRDLLEELPLTAGGAYDAPDFSEGAMFTSDYELYTYGGLPRSDASSATILNYRLHPVDGQTIFTAGPQTGVELDNGVTNYVTSGGAASSPSENKGWYFSGMRAASWGPLAQMAGNDPTDSRAVTNLSAVLITADMSSPGSATWHNTTLPDSVQPRINPELVWLPVAEQGVLLAIGGVLHHQKFGNYGLEDYQIEESELISPSFMQSIPVYDIATEEWHIQNTTGDAPDFRAEFCAVATSLNDDTSTYDIFVYGGDNGLPGSKAIYAHDDVWVLSVPSFHWIKVSDGTAKHGRSGHTCSLPFPNQMLVIGGQNLNSSNLCVQDGSVADVFNLNTLEWSRRYAWDSFEDYQRSSIISGAIESVAGPTTAVQALFDTTYRIERMTWYPYAAPDSRSNNATDGTTIIESTTRDSSINSGAIAGGVVSGVAVLLAGFLLFWFCRPSRRAARKSRNSTAYTETTLGTNAVSRWLRRTNFNEPPQRQPGIKEGSETDGTSSEDHVVPAAHARPRSGQQRPAELYGDNRARHEMASNDDGFSPRSSTVVESVYRTRHTSVEAGSQQIHEMPDESTVSPRQSIQKPGQPYVWQAEKVPFASIDEKPISEMDVHHAANSQPDVSYVGSDIAVSRTSADQLSRPSFGGPERRPAIERNGSSISSELPTTPPSRDTSAFRMSANSAGPISPMLEGNERISLAGALLGDGAERPTYRRHGSSLISAMSEVDPEALQGEKKSDGDRREAQRILEGKAEEVNSPTEVSPMFERKHQPSTLEAVPELRHAASITSRFKKDVESGKA